MFKIYLLKYSEYLFRTFIQNIYSEHLFRTFVTYKMVKLCMFYIILIILIIIEYNCELKPYTMILIGIK